MQMLWCWRCKSDVPMVDEKEWNALCASARDAGMRAADWREGRPQSEKADAGSSAVKLR